MPYNYNYHRGGNELRTAFFLKTCNFPVCVIKLKFWFLSLPIWLKFSDNFQSDHHKSFFTSHQFGVVCVYGLNSHKSWAYKIISRICQHSNIKYFYVEKVINLLYHLSGCCTNPFVLNTAQSCQVIFDTKRKKIPTTKEPNQTFFLLIYFWQ